MNNASLVLSSFLLFFYNSALFSTGEQQGPPQNIPDKPITVVFSPKIYNQIETSAGIKDQSVRNMAATSSSTSSALSAIKDIAFVQKVSDKSAALMAMMMEFFHNKEKQQSLLDHLKSTCCEYKWRLIFGSLGASYLYLTYKLKSLEHALVASTVWSQWKKGSTSELYSIPDSELAHELLIAIQRQYTTLSSLNDFNTPLIAFMNDIKKEEKMLNDYYKLVKRLELFRVAGYFSINHSLVESIASRKDKLAYLQSRLWNWVSEHKLHSHLK